MTNIHNAQKSTKRSTKTTNRWAISALLLVSLWTCSEAIASPQSSHARPQHKASFVLPQVHRFTGTLLASKSAPDDSDLYSKSGAELLKKKRELETDIKRLIRLDAPLQRARAGRTALYITSGVLFTGGIILSYLGFVNSFKDFWKGGSSEENRLGEVQFFTGLALMGVSVLVLIAAIAWAVVIQKRRYHSHQNEIREKRALRDEITNMLKARGLQAFNAGFPPVTRQSVTFAF